jgi:hypothetical protein
MASGYAIGDSGNVAHAFAGWQEKRARLPHCQPMNGIRSLTCWRWFAASGPSGLSSLENNLITEILEAAQESARTSDRALES